MTLIQGLGVPAIRCIGLGLFSVYYENQPSKLVIIPIRHHVPLVVCLPYAESFFFGLNLTPGFPDQLLSSFCLPYLCTVDWEVYWHVTASLKCVLTQEHLDAICAKYFIPEEVHPQLPRSDATVHERPAGKNLDSVKNWNDHFLWVDEFVVPANARFSWFSGSNIIKDRAPAPSEYNVEHVNTLIAQASPFLRFPEEFLCWVGISRNYLLNKDTYPALARAENERPIVTVAKHRTVTLLPTLVVRSSGELSASVVREFVGDASVGDGGDQGFDSVGGQDNIEPTVPITEHVETETPGPKRTKKKRVIRECERTTAASQPPKRLRADYGTTRGIPTLPTLPFITSSVAASPLEEGGDYTDSAMVFSAIVGLPVRFVVLSILSSRGAKSADPEVDSLVRSATPVMTEATTVATIATTVAIPADVGSGFAAGSIRAEEAIGAGLEKIYVPEWTVTKGFELNDGHSYANMIDHFTPPAFFKTIRGIEYEQLFAEFNVSASRNLSLSSEVHGDEISSRSPVGRSGEYEGSHETWHDCLTDLEAYIPSAEVDFNSAIRDLRDLNFLLLQELSNKKDANTWDTMDLLRLDDDVDRVVIGSQALSVALDICRGRVEKMERNLVERLPFLKDVFVSLDHSLSAEALIERGCVPVTNVLLLGEGNINAATGGDLAFSKLDDEARDAVLPAYGAFYTRRVLAYLLRASCDSYGLHLGHKFPVSSHGLLHVARYTKSLAEACISDFGVNSKLFSNASSFFWPHLLLLSEVGIIFCGMTASVRIGSSGILLLSDEHSLSEAFEGESAQGFDFPVYFRQRVTVLGACFVEVFKNRTIPPMLSLSLHHGLEAM
ncbi:hypothetical protein Tco_0353016 [Tanacetum coccineum]